MGIYPGYPMVELSYFGGDGVRGSSWPSFGARANGMQLSAEFPGTPEAQAWNYVYRQPDCEIVQGGLEFSELFNFTPPPATLTAPASLSFFDAAMGRVYVRKDWTRKSTWVGYMAGPLMDIHGHLQQGSMKVSVNGREVMGPTGSYDIDIGTKHALMYGIRTVASSMSFLIKDPNERFGGFVGWAGDWPGAQSMFTTPDGLSKVTISNDGGQNTADMPGLPTSYGSLTPTIPQYKAIPGPYNKATTTNFADDGTIVSWVSDLTNAYNNPTWTTENNTAKVQRVWRRVVYIRPFDMIVTGDTVETTDPSFQKALIIHAPQRLSYPSGPSTVLGAGESIYQNVSQFANIVDDSQPNNEQQQSTDLHEGTGMILGQTVLPQSNFQYHQYSGRTPAMTEHEQQYQTDPSVLQFHHFHRHIMDFFVPDPGVGIVENHGSYNWAPEEPQDANRSDTTPTVMGGFGVARLEVEPNVGQTVDHIVTLLMMSSDLNARLPPVTAVTGPHTTGAAITGADGHTYTITFDTDTLQPPNVSIQ